MTGKKRITTQLLPQGTASFRRERSSIRQLRTAARSCRDCDLWRSATQTVFGEGPQRARIVLIGEQPGNREDQEGHPFVGPAGRLQAPVKHFKFEQRGKLRLRKRANAEEQAACRQWLDAELLSIQPQVIVCLGAMAANAIFGASFRLLKQRGKWREIAPGVHAFATVHPSYLLRMRDEDRDAAYRQLVRELSSIMKYACD